MKKIASYGALVALVGVGICLIVHRSSDDSKQAPEKVLVAKRSAVRVNEVRGRRRPPALSLKKKVSLDVTLPGAPALERRAPELMGVSRREEREFTELARSVLRELQHAIDTKDLKTLRALVARMYADPQSALGMAEVPVAFRRKLVQSFAWFGNDGAVDLMQFLADDDPTVVDMTRDAYAMSAMDFTVSDRERAEFILAAAQTLTDERTVNMVMSAVQTLRHSVGVETIQQIMATGTEVAQAKLPDTVRAFTQNADIETGADLNAWLAEHPDGAMDDQLYGGWKAMLDGFKKN